MWAKGIGLGLALALGLLAGSSTAAADSRESVRPAAVAGTWYPADPGELRSLVDGLLAQAPAAKHHAPIQALIVPHAGYRYSGPVAAAAFKRVQGQRFARVIVLGPSHRKRFHGLSIDAVVAYATPLGQVPLDSAAVQALRRSPLVTADPSAHTREHSIEMELPLLQRALAPGWKLVPILVGAMSPEDYAKAAALLRPIADERTLIVVSSDFTHYGPRFDYVPFAVDDGIAQRLRDLDMGIYERIAAHDPGGLLAYKRRTGVTACGFDPMMILLNLLAPDTRVERVKYATSGELTGDYHTSVSYLAVAITRGPSDPPPAGDQGLSQPQMQVLYDLARAAVEASVRPSAEAMRALRAAEDKVPEGLHRPGAAFVTVTRHARLRGCIGTIKATEPLYASVMHNAVNAVRNDMRFNPVTPAELGDLELEISVLSPMRPIASPDEFRVGKQGIVLEKDGRRAVFLPQVATEQGWDRDQTLGHLAVKAGLPADAWKTGAHFQVFTTQSYPATH